MKDVTGIPPISDSARLVDNDNDKVALFNSYFESVFSSPIVVALSPVYPTWEGSMPDIELSQNGILKLINDSNENKASGPGGMHCHVLKECCGILSLFLRVLFDKFLSSGSLPEVWKISHVLPVYKGGKRNNVENYRPISLPCVCSKILEHIVYSSLAKHININNF